MKNTFIGLSQKCIYLDLYLSSLISFSSSYNILKSIKLENSKNISLISHLYRRIYNDSLDITYLNPSTFLEYDKIDLNVIVRLIFDIVLDLKYLIKHNPSVYSKRILISLKNSYFDFISSFQSSSYLLNENISDNIENQNNFSKILNIYDNFKNVDYNKESCKNMKNLSIKTLNNFFDTTISDETILDESLEIFFKNNPNLRFYQYIFKTCDKIFKIKIYDIDKKIFYISQDYYHKCKNLPKLDKEEYKNIIDNFLSIKLDKFYTNLYYDKTYFKNSQYNSVSENYTFKYDFKSPYSRISPNKSIYITINISNLMIYEILLL